MSFAGIDCKSLCHVVLKSDFAALRLSDIALKPGGMLMGSEMTRCHFGGCLLKIIFSASGKSDSVGFDFARAEIVLRIAR